MKNFKSLTIPIVAVLAFLLFLPAAGIASSVSYSGFRLWDFQAYGADGTMLDFSLFSGNVSVSDSVSGEKSLQQIGTYKYEVETVQTSNEYANAESFLKRIPGIDVGSNASVNIPMTTDSLFETNAGGETVLSELLVPYYTDFVEENETRETKLTFSFDYQSILTGFASEFGLFDSSLGVNIRLTNFDTNESISLFSLNDSISGENTNISHNDGIQHFEKELTVMMGEIAFYTLDISINAKAYAATQVTPEPSAILLLGSGLIAAFIGIRRKKS